MAVPHFRDIIVAVLPVQATPLYIEQYHPVHGKLGLVLICGLRMSLPVHIGGVCQVCLLYTSPSPRDS